MSLTRAYRRACNTACEIVPQKKRESTIYPLLKYAGINQDFDVWLGKRIIFSLLAGLIGFFLPWAIARYFVFEGFSQTILSAFSILLFIVFTGFSAFIYYLNLYYMIESRAEQVEKALPDFLLLVSSNIKSGLTPFSSFRASARKEFGPLAEEVKLATSKALGTASFSDALHELTQRINSRSLNESFSFFAQSLRSGGHLSKLLETTAFDLKKTEELKKELQSSTKMYVIFVVFVVLVATPLLMSISVQFLEMVHAIKEASSFGAESSTMGFLSSDLMITPEFLEILAIVLFLGNSLLAGIFIGMLTKAKAKIGLKYFPLLLGASLIVFYATLSILPVFLPSTF
jgi:hypothetical protein